MFNNNIANASYSQNEIEVQNDEEEFLVTYNTNGGSYVKPALTKNQKVVMPNTPVKGGSKNIFAGWYYGNELWDFNNVVTKNITLAAKWSGLECKSQNTIQIINATKAVTFNIDVQNTKVNWFVNDILQQGQLSNTFIFKPKEERADYTVHCVVNNVASKKVNISVGYVMPTALELTLDNQNKNVYSFKITDGNYFDPNNIVWFKTNDTISTSAQMIGFGATCSVELNKNCFVYAVYNDQIISNKIEITNASKLGNEIIYISAGAAAIAITVVAIYVISKKRYNLNINI